MTTKSFTLIELLVVIMIVGIIAGILIVSLNGAVASANYAKIKSDLSQLTRSVMVYKINHSDTLLPIDADGCNIGNDCVDIFGNASIFKNPNGSYYKYTSTDGIDFTITASLSSEKNYLFDSKTESYYEASAATNGQCGSADGKTYPASASSYGEDTFCVAGSSSPESPAFPSGGGTTNWSCLGANGGSSDSCSANKLAPVAWIAETAIPDDNKWDTITYGNGLYVAIAYAGSGNRIMTSPDGITWTARVAGALYWRDITYGNGLFVAVNTDGANRVSTSPDGITWTQRPISNGAYSWRSVIYGDGKFVAVSWDTPYAMTSPDGITWTVGSAGGVNRNWQSVAYGNGKFVAISHPSNVMTSPDGITWTEAVIPRNSWTSITYGNGLFVAVSSGGTDRIMTSPDGITWTIRTAAEANPWNSVTYGNGQFVAVASYGTHRIMTSPDGITWTLMVAPEANMWNSVTYGNGQFVAIAINGTHRVMRYRP